MTKEDIRKACEYMRVDPDGADLVNSDWIVSKTGDMLGHPSFEYLIQDDQLKYDYWMTHMVEKTWVNADTFVEAYIEALCRAGIKELVCDVSFSKSKELIRPFELRGDKAALHRMADELARSVNEFYGL